MKINLSTALHIQLPPDKSIARFKTNVAAKKNEAKIPSTIAFKFSPPSSIQTLPTKKHICTPHYKLLTPVRFAFIIKQEQIWKWGSSS